jgi:ribonuclease HII
MSLAEGARHGLVGVDEAGRGPLAGPVVAAAVQLDLSRHIDGVDDSKRLSEKKRETLYSQITSQALAWAVGTADHDEIDRLNILKATSLAMHRALQKIGCSWSLVAVDGNRPVEHIDPAIQRSIVGGDALSASIAAASILAKVTRDRIMREYDTKYPLYYFAVHKGYPTRQHRDCILEHGLCKIHRRTFCEKLMCQITLDFSKRGKLPCLEE